MLLKLLHSTPSLTCCRLLARPQPNIMNAPSDVELEQRHTGNVQSPHAQEQAPDSSSSRELRSLPPIEGKEA